MAVLLLALLIIWPVAELAAMVGVAIWLGVLPMFGLLLLSTIAGLLILRYRGEVHWRRLRNAVSERRPPAREAFDGTMITAGALLLVLPGFISSALGLLLLTGANELKTDGALCRLDVRNIRLAYQPFPKCFAAFGEVG